jgi:protein arginine kinase activator
MLCDKCKVREATYHSTVNINGNVTETHLCSECAISENKINNIFNAGNFFATPFNTGEFFESSQKLSEKSNETICEGCKKTYSEFLNLGLLGCPKCYETFKQELYGLMKNIQPEQYHTGKKLNSHQPIESEELKIKNLEFKLKQAVASENYELASELKKRINELKNGGGNEHE